MNCPHCNSDIEKNNINIPKDIAYCLDCDKVFTISEHLNIKAEEEYDITRPPKGAWFRQERRKKIIGATTRSCVGYFLLPFTLIWSGGSLGGIYGTQIIEGELQLEMALFGIPFIIGTFFLIAFTAMFLAGKIEVTLENNKATVFTGVGSIGLRKTFDTNSVNNIRVEERRGSKGKRYKVIIVETHKKISFGSFLTEERTNFMYFALRKNINPIF